MVSAGSSFLPAGARSSVRKFARYSIPLKLTFPRGKRDRGTLEIKIEPARAIEIQHLEPQLLERINLTLGFSAVSRLTLRQGRVDTSPKAAPLRALTAVEQRTLEQKVAGISASESLKNALERLGRCVFAKPDLPRPKAEPEPVR